MNTIASNEANGRHPGHATGEELTLTCGEEMDTEENMDSTRATLLDILEDRAARILENEKDISAVERVLAILDAKQRTGDEGVEEGTEATDEAEVTNEAGPKPRDEEAEEQPHTGPADLLSMPIDRLKEIVSDPEATAMVFLQARGGEPLDCPKCGSGAHTKRSPGKERRPDLFRCTPCKAGFGIRTGTAMHGSRETLGTWLMAIKLMADTGGAASARDLSDLTGTGAGFTADMAAAILSKMGSPGGLLAAVVRVGERAKTYEETDTGQETPGPETPGEEAGSGAAARVALPSGPITELSLDGMRELAGDDIACAGLFMAARDQDGIDCPRCGLREETKRIGPFRPAQFRCRICNSIYSVRTGTQIEGPTTSLGQWTMAGYLAATGTAPEDEGELALLIGTTRNMARRIMHAAARICPEGQDPVPALVQVTARRPQDDGQADADKDTDMSPRDPMGEAQTGQAAPPAPAASEEKGAQEGDPGAGPRNGAEPGGSEGAGQPASGADILSPDG